MSASLTPPADDRQPLDPSIVEQAIAWHVLLLSGHADEAQRAACEAWCHAHETHERAWQRIAGLGRDMRRIIALLLLGLWGWCGPVCQPVT